MRIIVSPIGTSLLTNGKSNDERTILNQNANHKINDITDDDALKLIEQIKTQHDTTLPNLPIDQLKKASAELNSILSFYKNNLQGNHQDVHFLIATDTYQAKVTSEILANYLKPYFNTVETIIPPGLSTKNKKAFQTGIKFLLKEFDDFLPEYKAGGYDIIFNLTGGFKSLQGYLNTIGMFYADEIIYIFERSDELISIPRLPIEIQKDMFVNNASTFVQLSQNNEGVELSRLDNIHSVMMEEYADNKYILSDWGELSWNRVKKDILSASLIDLPFISYAPSFINDFTNTREAKKKIELQEKIAFVSCQLQNSNGDISILKAGRSGGVLYDNYSGNNSHLGHFRIGQGPRVSCEYKNGMLELRHYGEHDYVNDNP